MLAHALVVVWMCSEWTRLRLILFDFVEVPSEAFMTLAPESTMGAGYTEDDPVELERYRSIAQPIVSGARTDGEKMRRLADYIYTLRRSADADSESELREGLSVVLDRLERGDAGNCAQASAVLAAMWRSLGGHTRGVRWATVKGKTGHFAVELYSTIHRRWMYYDMNVNGYWADDDGIPVSIAALRSNLLTGEDVVPVGNADPRFHDWTGRQFQQFLQKYPVEWYALNNNYLYMERDRRFGRLNQLYPLLSRLPYPVDRVVDNVVGMRDRRMVVDGKIQVAGLFTFTGARVIVIYSLAVTLICAGTLLLNARKIRRITGRDSVRIADWPSGSVLSGTVGLGPKLDSRTVE